MELNERRVGIQLTPEILDKIRELKGEEAFKKLLSDTDTSEEESPTDPAPF